MATTLTAKEPPVDLGDRMPVVVVWQDHAFNRGPESDYDQDLIRFVTCGFQMPVTDDHTTRLAQSFNLTNDEYEDILVLDDRTIIGTWPLLR